MKNKPVMGIVLTILLLSIIAFSGCVEKTSKLEIVDIKVEDPKPSLLNDRHVTINRGESVTLGVTVQNKGNERIYGNTHSVGIKVKIPYNGEEYWEWPSEQLITDDLALKGESTHKFNAASKDKGNVTGNFKIQAYIKSEETNEVIPTSDKVVTIEITSQQKSSSKGFEVINIKVIFAIVVVLLVVVVAYWLTYIY